MLQELKEKIPQVWVPSKMDIIELSKIDLNIQKWRFDFIVSALRYSDALSFKLVDSFWPTSLIKINQIIADALTFANTPMIVGFHLSTIVNELSWEFVQENSNIFDYEVFEKYLKWKANYEDFIKETKVINKNNLVWNFVGKDWRDYSGQWFAGLIRLKWDDILNILNNYNWKDEAVEKAIAYIQDENNIKLIRKNYQNVRWAWLSILKHIIDPTENSSLIKINS